MINNIIAFSINNKLLIALLTLALIVAGIWSISKVPLDAVPDITNNQVQIITQSPSLGTEDIEQFISYPVELAMANLPGVVEIRSISRFGLSVVTIVFEEDMGTYLPRQLVAEKLIEVKENIPPEFGVPTMGPIATGLGEIYQYTLEVDSAHKDKYSTTDLRSIQDWIVRRQMAMVPGVVEINAFGGNIKQYEIAINPDEIRAMGISLTDIFIALEKNNENTGGAYIEKNHYANFIRGEGLIRSLEDIEEIVVSNKGGLPIKIKDIASVQFGKAMRYGAFTKDGQGEAVGGMVMMLKGANSNDVIKNVKARVEEIQKSLPEGVRIEPFLDRSDLIEKTISTIRNNLTEGALIVIFVLVFLLGNWRGGLIVASTIPLSLLFAFILMHVFDVWANLMSLGAIDFGIIVDGAVIIVEGTVFLLHDKLLKKKENTPELRKEVAFKASSKMMNSAFFGQLIILIVFIPILALEGVEGKMFKPMALSFIFAMIGVMILCLTYVPMMSAYFLNIGDIKKLSWGDKFIQWLEKVYDTVLLKALRKAKWVVVSALVLFALAAFSFNKLGGEFIPKLDEGDIAFHIMLKAGSSLTEAIESSTKIEQILLDQFPEIEHAMTRFGVADVPTDPMPMDVGDCFILLKPQDEWVSASSKAELIEKINEAVLVVPGISYEFSQPIEMRFNELITGVREDLAIKLFGEDLEILAAKAEEIAEIVKPLAGIGDIKVEAIDGLPQMTVVYNRHKLAQYDLNIEELNLLVQTAFAGGKAGVVFEGERRFDLVLRLDEAYRKSIDDLKNLYVQIPNGHHIPLKEVADISYKTGPMQISRDNTNRRTYVGINVRGRDMKSLVEEIQEKLDAELELPAGYYLRYGGAFENLERASNRLQVLVPMALLLVFVLVFFALKSFKQSLMIYMAIPLAAIGGVFSLWLRDMPFSISAGVGFIVLFGVAVLNGLVLISAWNELKEEGVDNINERIRLGAKRRIRPIMLTALTDIFGFLPMAISTSAGAEVQQPLATVVIGGMISATLLTLFILPILYHWVESAGTKSPSLSALSFLLLFAFTLVPFSNASAQVPKTISTVEEAINIALANNGNIEVAKSNIALQEQGKKAAFNLEKTKVAVQYGQYNSFENDLAFNVQQNFEFPTLYSKQRKLAKEKVVESEIELAATENVLKRDIRYVWYELSFLKSKEKLLLFQDTLFNRFMYAVDMRYEAEAATLLEKMTAETKRLEIGNALELLRMDMQIQENKLRVLLGDSSNLNFEAAALEERVFANSQDSTLLANNPMLNYAKQKIDIARAEKAVQVAKVLPDFSLGYTNQSMLGIATAEGNIATATDRYSIVQAGISMPLFFGAYKANIKAAKLKENMAKNYSEYYESIVQNEYEQLFQEVMKQQINLNYYKSKALSQADLIIENSQKSFENDAINYLEYFQNIKQGLEIKSNHLNSLKAYNQALINLEYQIAQ